VLPNILHYITLPHELSLNSWTDLADYWTRDATCCPAMILAVYLLKVVWHLWTVHSWYFVFTTVLGLLLQVGWLSRSVDRCFAQWINEV